MNHHPFTTMKFKKHFITAVLFGCLISLANAQAPTFTFSVSQAAQPTLNILDTIYTKTYHFDLNDTTTISKFHIKMGTTSGGSEVFSHVIDFDQTTNLPVGFNYSRDGMDVSLTVGAYHLGFFYYEAKLEDTSGTFSAVETEDSNTHLP